MINDRRQAITKLLKVQIKSFPTQIDIKAVEEIRIRAGRPVQLVFSDTDMIIPECVLSFDECQRLVQTLCENSVYAYENELRQGYITYCGCRVGLVGKAVCENGELKRFSEISGMNIRIASEHKDAASKILHYCTDGNGNLMSTLIVSPPGAGKTTLLRDITRRVSDGIGVLPKKVCVIDERMELCDCRHGIPEFEIGNRTDVLYGCPKAKGILLTIRTMSPDIIITDEIGTIGDCEAIRDALTSGVVVIASAHGNDFESLRYRAGIAEIIKAGLFDRYILIDRDEKGIFIKGIAGRTAAEGEKCII